jgi:hypothetical protein
VNMTRSKRVFDMCPTVSCPTRRIRDSRGGLDVLGDLDSNAPINHQINKGRRKEKP